MSKEFLITKEEFVDYINKIKSEIKRRDAFSDAIYEACDGHPVLTVGGEWLNTSLNLLSKIVGDTPDEYGTMIEWWFFEAKDGEKFLYYNDSKGNIDRKISINTPEELYDYFKNRD